ncbi:putative triosephosphate isomerase [Rosellinia necatrix]|uniref:Triosephosphate isomerase n=1 Tax=Rosellinia necatrix TaxID=77044 RepID=A0A1S7UJN1_ROSNE|nr:putative triosephosphate isomerase [Rosellinia necatrix]
MSAPPPRHRRRLVGVSTKMYFSFARTTSYVGTLLGLLASLPAETRAALRDGVDVFVVPDHVSLTSVIAQLRAASSASAPVPVSVLAGAQDAYHEDAGAFTGEVSPAVLAEVGCRLLEIGHAERRRLFGETDAGAGRRAAAAARHGLVPLVCVGERTRPPAHDGGGEDGGGEEGLAAAVAAALPEIRAQVEAALAGVPDAADVVLAYEPVWAIGASEPAGPPYVVAVARAIRALDCVRRRPAAATRILYGGSAGPGLFARLSGGGGGGDDDDDDGLDGLFLGRFAHDPEQFVKTILEVAAA